MLTAILGVPASVALAQSGNLALPDIPDKTCQLGTDVSKSCDFTLPRATGAQGIVKYLVGYQVFGTKAPYDLYSFNRNTLRLTVHAKPHGQAKNGWRLVLVATDEDPASEIGAIFGTVSKAFTVTFDGHPAVTLPTGDLNFTVDETVNERLRTSGNGDLTLSKPVSVSGYNAPASNRPADPEFTAVPGLNFGIDNNRASATPHLAYTTISGTPTQPGEYEVTLELTDGDGDASTSSTFKIFVNAAPRFGEARVPNTVFAIGEAREIALPEFTPGNGKASDHLLTLSYTAPWPSWLFDDIANPAAAKLSGTPPVGSDADAKIVTVTVKDYKLNDHFGQDSDTIELCFSVGDGERCEVSFGDATVDSQLYTVDTPIPPLTLPEALRATGEVEYGVSELPDGLVFDADTRTLRGTPTEFGRFPMTYTATDNAKKISSLEFVIEVDGAPSFAGARVANTVFAIGELGEISLPEATPGNGRWDEHTLSWIPGLPAWLTFDEADPTALKLGGTAPAGSDADAQVFELTLTDRAVGDETTGDSATLSLCFSVGGGEPCGVRLDHAEVADRTYTRGRPIAPLTLPEARLGTGELTYALDGLPRGLTFDPGTRRLSGTPSQSGGPFTATYTVTDTAEAEASLTFAITVERPLSFGGVAPSRLDFTEGAAVTRTLPAAEGGTGTLSYSASGLPAGLGFDASSRTLSGAPTRAGNFTLVLNATDENGASASLTFPVRVHPPVSFPPQTLDLGFPGPADTLPAARGGFGTLTYSLACRAGTPDPCAGDGLPPGLTFDAETRSVSGDFATSGHYFLKLTATDRNGAKGTKDFALRVAGIIVKAYADQADQTAGTLITGSTIPVPEIAGDARIANAPRYTLELAVAPGSGNRVWIDLSEPSGDGDLQYFLRNPRRHFEWSGNNFTSQGSVVLFAMDDVDGENGRATIRHTVGSDDGTYDGITFDVNLVEVDNDPSVTLSLDPAELAEDAGETEVTVTATVVAPPGDPSLTTFAEETVIALGLAGGTATSPADYTAAFSENLVFGTTDTSATAKFKLTPADDELYEEPAETVVVTGTGTDTDTGKKWSTGSATLTITDDDTPDLVADCGTREVTEGGGGQTMHLICTVTLRDADGNPVTTGQDTTFRYRTIDDTAIAGEDYEHREGEVTIKAGESSASFLLAVYDDDEREPTERFKVEFFASPPFATIPVAIYDDDTPAPPSTTEKPTEGEEGSGEDGDTGEEGGSNQEDAYRATVGFGATAYTATEGEPAATVVVKLEPAPPESLSVSIPVAGRGGAGVTPDDWRIVVNADAGDTWNAAAGAASVVFAPGETERTFALQALDDDDFEGNETLTLAFDAARLPEGVTADPAAAESVVTLVDDDLEEHRGRALKPVLAAFGRTVASDAVALLTGRMEDDARQAGSRAALAGRTLRLGGALPGAATLAGADPAGRGAAFSFADAHGPGSMSGLEPRTREITLHELLVGSSFRHRLGSGEGGDGAGNGWLTLWGEGGTARFEGRPEPGFSLDGETASGWLGIDWRGERTVAGLSLTHHRGEVDYALADAPEADGAVELDLTGLFPYARLSLDDDLDLWGIAGLGTGRLELADGFGGNRSDLSMQVAAGGVRRTMKPAGEHGAGLAAKADGFVVRIGSDAAGLETPVTGDELPEVDAGAGRVRFALEAGYVHTLASGAVLRPTADLGARLDTGDADTGAGVDLAGEVRYESRSGRVTLEGRGRAMLAHSAESFREWAASGLVRLSPRAGGRGFSLSVTPSWGLAASRAGALWDADLPDAASDAHARVNAEVGYGLAAFGGRGRLTPWAGTDLASGEERTWRAGMRLELRRNFALSLQGSRRDNARGGPEHEIGARLSIVFR